MPTATPPVEYLSLLVDGNGQYFLNLVLEQGLTVRVFETGIFTERGWNYFAISLDRTLETVYGVTYYYNTVTFYAGHATFAITSLGEDDKTLTRAKLKSFSSTWERTTVNKALAGDVPVAATNMIFGGRHFQWPDYYSGLMHGFFHSLTIYDQAVSVEILA